MESRKDQILEESVEESPSRKKLDRAEFSKPDNILKTALYMKLLEDPAYAQP